MDMTINKILKSLTDAALPSTIEDLKNPTQDSIINLLTAFLSQFNIDVNVIYQLISEQYTVMTYYEDSDIVYLINLHAVVTQIFNEIFLNDFCLNDITNPGHKRFKKHAKYISNFVLYANQKKLEFSEKNNQIEVISRQLEELKERNMQIVKLIKNNAKHKSNQLLMIKKLESDIQHVLSETEILNKKELQIESRKNEVEKENQSAKESCCFVKTTMGKLSKKIVELQPEIVNSPEEYQSRLDELKVQYKLKLEKRDTIQEAIQEKKQSIKQIGEKLNFVPKMNDMFSTLMDTYKELINKKTKLDNIKKQIDLSNKISNEWQNKLAMHKDQMSTEMNKVQLHREEDIVPLLKLRNQLLSEKEEQKAKFDTNQACCNEKYLKKNQLQTDIKKKEEKLQFLSTIVKKFMIMKLLKDMNYGNIWRKNRIPFKINLFFIYYLFTFM
ncbi:probable kinetochore protein NUF2, partial [Nylanderia fulva]|uniref:probable kinetochore protein NUF2 n=1 Tax=Nylanderia fulva TaxID=613905 RepID=UPI0010FAF8F8